MMRPPSDLLWPVEDLSAALEQLAQRAGYGTSAGEVVAPPADVEPGEQLKAG